MDLIFTIFRDLLVQLLPSRFSKYIIKPKEFVWLVHPRDLSDFFKKMHFLKIFPGWFISFMIRFLPPFIISNFFIEQKNLKGYVIAIPLLPHQINYNPKLAAKKTKRALKFAEKIGAKYISLGGFLPSIVYKNGFDKRFPFVFFDGTNLLARLTLQTIEEILSGDKTSREKLVFGIIGATTKTGSILTKLLVQEYIYKIILFGKTEEHLTKLREECLEIRKDIHIEISTNLADIDECDFVILTAYLTEGEVIMNSLKKNAIFLSAIEPVSPFVFELEKTRKDVKLIKGISVKTPGVTYEGYDFGLPKGNSFVCITEGIILIDDKQATDSLLSFNLKRSLNTVKELFNKYKFNRV